MDEITATHLYSTIISLLLQFSTPRILPLSIVYVCHLDLLSLPPRILYLDCTFLSHFKQFKYLLLLLDFFLKCLSCIMANSKIKITTAQSHTTISPQLTSITI